jgi:hypothetical protein
MAASGVEDTESAAQVPLKPGAAPVRVEWALMRARFFRPYDI